MRACVRREWRLGDDRGATADAVELAEWTINYIAADPALPLQNVDRLNTLSPEELVETLDALLVVIPPKKPNPYYGGCITTKCR